MNDPDGLVYYTGEYHLFYQYNPFGNIWDHMSWGHAVSTDMIHWKQLPVALPEADGVMVFTGSAVVDWNNTSGFGLDGKPPLVAIYAGYRRSDNVQFQCIAYSNDKGRTWTKYAGNPVLDINSKDFRDPKVQWHQATSRWIMTVALSAEHKIRIYGSKNLKEWTLLSEFGPAGAVAGAWECPDLFELPVQESKEKLWTLTVSVDAGLDGGSLGQYFVGTFDGTKFTPKPAPTLLYEFGPDCYDAVSWSDVPKTDGRRLWLGWMGNWAYSYNAPTTPWRGTMSIPRELHLRQTSAGVRLTQTPARETESLRNKHYAFKGGGVAEANAWIAGKQIAGKQLELIIIFAPAPAGVEGVKVLKSASEDTAIGLDHTHAQVFLDRTRSGIVNFHPKFSGVFHAPLATGSQPVNLHIFVDNGSVEVFANDGECVLTGIVFPGPESRHVEFFGTDLGAKILSIEAWTLKSIWNQAGLNPTSPGKRGALVYSAAGA